MRFIPTKIHGLLDYLVAIILIVLPWLLHFAGQNSQTYILVALGIATILYSMLTNYEWGAVNIIPMAVHLRLDLFSGIVLALSPWFLNFSKFIYLPHLVLGILEVIVSLLSRTMPYKHDPSKLTKARASFFR